jgi:hypothetical protein
LSDLNRAYPLLFDGTNLLRIGAEFNHNSHLGVQSDLFRNYSVDELEFILLLFTLTYEAYSAVSLLILLLLGISRLFSGLLNLSLPFDTH